MESKTLLQLSRIRVHTISKLDISGIDTGKKPMITDKAFVAMPVDYGLAIECNIGKGDDGEDMYYVIAFVKWDSRHGEPEYDALLDRIADVWAESPDTGSEFKQALEFAEAEVAKANRGEDDRGYEYE
jgi:hypothetical protein